MANILNLISCITLFILLSLLITPSYPCAHGEKKKVFIIKQCNQGKFIFFIDLILFILVAYFLTNDILSKLSSSFENLYYYFNNFTDIIFNAADNSDNISTNTTTTNITHSESGCSSSIRQIFIYGSGALRLHLLKGGGTPASRAFVISSTLITDAASNFAVNTINDPVYVENHINSWTRILISGKTSIDLHVDNNVEIFDKLNFINNLSPNDLNNFSESLFNKVIEIISPILQPISVSYSSQTLATQIYGLSIILFIMSIFIIILLLSLMINIVIFLYSDKISNFFTNKYIKWYLTLNKKFISIEICFLGCSILYFMYTLITGIRFIAIHPIIIN